MIKKYYIEYEEICKVRYLNGVTVLAESEKEAIDKVNDLEFISVDAISEDIENDFGRNITHIEEVEE